MRAIAAAESYSGIVLSTSSYTGTLADGMVTAGTVSDGVAGTPGGTEAYSRGAFAKGGSLGASALCYVFSVIGAKAHPHYTYIRGEEAS